MKIVAGDKLYEVIQSIQEMSELVESIKNIKFRNHLEDLDINFDDLEDTFRLHKDKYLLMFDGNKLIGYISIFPVSSELYNNILDSDGLYNRIEEKCILEYADRNVVVISDLEILKEYIDIDAIEEIGLALANFIRQKNIENKVIDYMLGFTRCKYEEDIMHLLNANELYSLKEYNSRNKVFILGKCFMTDYMRGIERNSSRDLELCRV